MNYESIEMVNTNDIRLNFLTLVGFSMQLLDQGHHPYISTGCSGKHFTPFLMEFNVVRRS